MKKTSVNKLFVLEQKTEEIIYDEMYPQYILNDYSYIYIDGKTYLIIGTLFCPKDKEVWCNAERFR